MDNSEQVEFWNGDAAVSWVRDQEQMDRMLAPLSTLALASANPRPGDRALDIGCGCGSTTLAIGDAGAEVVGVDVSKPMLAHAKQRAGSRSDVSFACADAATESYVERYDLVFSRFGVMFFADPVAAFSNIRTALSETGRMVFICWRSPGENQWMSVPASVMRNYSEGSPPQDPGAPGPFAFADADRLRAILDKAGFRSCSIEPIDADFPMAADLESGLVTQTTTGPMARMYAAIADEKKEAALADLRSALAPFVGEAGLVFTAGAWLVRAER